VGAAISTAGSGTSSLGSGFVQPMVEDGLGMCRSPAVGQQLFQSRIVRMQAEKKLTYIRPRFEAMNALFWGASVAHTDAF
jgi:hypothetical protein